MGKRNKLNMNVGIISFMVIFIILCLVTFAILSIVSAKSNMRSAENYANHASYYYTIENMANKELKQIDEQLKSDHQAASSSADYYSRIKNVENINGNIILSNHTISFEITYRETKISVSLEALYNQKTYYKITKWESRAADEKSNSGSVNIYPDSDDSGTTEVWGND
jgi:hypothetical protein